MCVSERGTGTQRDKANVTQHFGFFDPVKKKTERGNRRKEHKGRRQEKVKVLYYDGTDSGLDSRRDPEKTKPVINP